MSNDKKDKIIVIVGPTASGKTGLAVDLAFRYGGEIISADSRQVYKGMDVGTGKDLGEYKRTEKRKKIKIPYYLIDLVSPKTEFNLAKYYKKAEKCLAQILKKGKLPIIAGGTGLYAQALVEGYNLKAVKPDPEFRRRMKNLSASELYKKLEQLNPRTARKLNNSDKNNPRRLIRYLENLKKGQSVSDLDCQVDKNREFLVLALFSGEEILKKRIYKRLKQRIEKEGMIQEVSDLHKHKKVSWKRLKGFGLEYRYVSRYLQGEISKEDLLNDLYIAIYQFAKRQITWLRRWERQGREIIWAKNRQEAFRQVKEFLKK